jgi:hypothetical protein
MPSSHKTYTSVYCVGKTTRALRFFTTVWVPSMKRNVNGGFFARPSLAAVVHDASCLLRNKPMANGCGAEYERELRDLIGASSLIDVPLKLRSNMPALERLANSLEAQVEAPPASAPQQAGDTPLWVIYSAPSFPPCDIPVDLLERAFNGNGMDTVFEEVCALPWEGLLTGLHTAVAPAPCFGM